MASRLITANCPRVVRYLPNLDAAVRHFTSYLRQDLTADLLSEPEKSNKLSIGSPSSSIRLDSLSLTNLGYPYKHLNTGGVNVDLSVLEQFAPGAEETVNITPTVMDSLECVAQPCPNMLKKELKELFPGMESFKDLRSSGGTSADVTVITLSQRTHNDMSGWSSAVEEEREQLLDKFISGAKEICDSLKQAGYWADFIDPSSGAPYFGEHTNATLFETDERYKSLGFEIDDLGCCKVIRHKQWGTHAYVGSLFTDAPMNLPVIQKLMQE